jgi:Ca-activated chloride channel homolog
VTTPEATGGTTGRPRLRVALLILLALALVATTVLVLRGQGVLAQAEPECPSSPVLTVVADPAVEPALREVVTGWNATKPRVQGACVTARTAAQSSAQAAATLGPAWNPGGTGRQPQAWVPDSALWLSVAKTRPEAAQLVQQPGTSLATSPVVMALRKPMATALGWPQRPLTRETIVGALSRPDIFAKAGHPEWAAAKIGLTDASSSTAGLAMVLSLLDPQGTGKVSEQQLLAGLQMSRLVGGYAPDASTFLADPDGAVAAFPALEQQIAQHNTEHPDAAMAPAYDGEQPVVADFPMVALSAAWVTDADRAALAQLTEYATGPQGQAVLAKHHLRAPGGAAVDAASLPAPDGYPATLPAARPVPGPQQLSGVMEAWADLQRKVNLLVVLDTSGSMKDKVPGTKLTRLGLLQQTATTGFGLLPHTMSIGLWEFSGRPGDSDGRRELVPFGPYPGKAGTVPRAQALTGSVRKLQPIGSTPLYNTIYAAFRTAQKNWQPNSTNSVVLITDGANEIAGGLSLEDLTAKLAKEQNAERPVQIVTIAVGPDADAGSLQRVSTAAGGRTLVLREPQTAIQTLVLAFTGRLQ